MPEILLAVRVVISLGVVVLLLWGLSRYLDARQGGAAKRAVPLSVVGRAGLGRNTSVAVVEVGPRLLVLGVAEKSVTLLSEMDAEEFGATSHDRPTVLAASAEGATMTSADLTSADVAQPAADSFGEPVLRPVAALAAADSFGELGLSAQPARRAPSHLEGPAQAPALAAVPFQPRLVTDDAPVLSRRERSARERALAAHPAGGAHAVHSAGGAHAAQPTSDDALDAVVTPLRSTRRTAGSVLDPATWQQTARAIKQLRKAQ